MQAEKKRADKLQEKMINIDETQIVEHERLAVPKNVPANVRDETSSVGSWSLPTEFDGVTILTGQEAEEILEKNKRLLEAKLQLEEQLRALERNQIQMSEELANRFVGKSLNSQLLIFSKSRNCHRRTSKWQISDFSTSRFFLPFQVFYPSDRAR